MRGTLSGVIIDKTSHKEKVSGYISSYHTNNLRASMCAMTARYSGQQLEVESADQYNYYRFTSEDIVNYTHSEMNRSKFHISDTPWSIIAGDQAHTPLSDIRRHVSAQFDPAFDKDGFAIATNVEIERHETVCTCTSLKSSTYTITRGWHIEKSTKDTAKDFCAPGNIIRSAPSCVD